MIRLSIAALFAFAQIASSATAQDPTVKIYVRGPSGAAQGTGFIVTAEGQIITAYHVIEGATTIEVVHETLGTFSDVRVDFISTDYDLAAIEVLNAGTKFPHLTLSAIAPNLADDLIVQGYPRQGAGQQFRTHATRQGYVSSQDILDGKGHRLFDHAIDVVSLDLTVYDGMSGAPVISRGTAIGVLSGSYDEGGGIGWAIPAKYLQQMQQVGKLPAEIDTWPPLRLMSPQWRTLRANVHLNAGASVPYEQYVSDVESLAQCYGDLREQSPNTLRAFNVSRPFLERAISDPSYAQDTEKVVQLLEAPTNEARKAFEYNMQLVTDCEDDYRNVAVALSGIMAWVVDESNLSNKEGVRLTSRLRAIRDTYSDLNNASLESYVAINSDAVGRALPDISTATNSTDPITRARGLLALIDTFSPVLTAYSSFRAMTYTSRTIGKFRQIARLFEPVVYPTQSDR